REGKWKYIHKVNPELYDMSADPGELSNLYEAEPDVAARLFAKLETIVAAAPTRKSDSVVPVSQRVASQLRALGYVEVEGEEALSFVGESLELFGDDPRSKTEDIDLAGWAMGAVVAKKYEDALTYAEPLRQRNPDSALAVGLVAESLAGLARWDEAIPMLRHSIELNPTSFSSRETLVTGLVARKNTLEAIEQLRSLNRDRSCDDSTLGMLNQLLHEQELYEEQRDLVAAAADACPELLTNLNNYAWLLATVPDAELRDGNKAIRVIRQAISDLEKSNVAFLDTLAAAMAEVGRFEDAIKVQTEVIDSLKKTGASDDALSEFFDHLKSYEAGKPLQDAAE
ncbi:MAG: tetratricopeptide (TPR) repeat protein, partial [Myxococcota bacterium]